MNLEHSFTVPVGIDEAWKILLDIELIGPCMPGAAIDSVDGDDFTGTVKVKLGPIGLTYKGKASFVEKDEAAHRAVIDARGRDARGNGTASAKVTATLTESDGSTKVDVLTDLDITGKPAQFGRGVMVDVGNKLIGQFADNLSATISADRGAGDVTEGPDSSAGDAATSSASSASTAGTAASATSSAPTTSSSSASSSAAGSSRPSPVSHATRSTTPRTSSPEPINLIESAGPAVAKRLAPLVAGALVVLLVLRRRKRR